MVNVMYTDQLVYKVVIWASLELVYEQREKLAFSIVGVNKLYS